MEHDPGIFEHRDEQAEALAVAHARSDAAEGRAYPHEVVREWLATLGSPGYKPFWEWLAARNG